LAKAIRYMTQHRAVRWSIRRVRETHRWHEPQSAARDGDHRCVALQKGVLLDGTVKRVLWGNRIIPNIERGRMVPQHPVSHGYFGGQRLQGVQALVGVRDGSLKFLILAFQ